MNLTLKQIEAFYWSAKLGSFSAASAHLHTTQSAVSKRIAELESSMTLLLFDRTRKRPILTTNGRALVSGAEELLELATRIGAQVDGKDAFAGRFRIGVTELSALTWLPGLVELVRQRYPRLVLEPDVDAGRSLFDRLEDGALDLIVIPGNGKWNKRYRATFLATMENAWMASPLLEVPHSTIPASELGRYPLLMQSSTSAVSQLYESWLVNNGVSFKRALRTNSLPVLGQLTLAGVGISALPCEYYRAEVAQKRLLMIKTRPKAPSFDYYAVHRAGGDEAIASELGRLVVASCNFRRSP